MEVIPAPWTDPEVVVKTKELLTEIGQVPVIVKKEIDGFVLNRIQYSIIGECWRLYEVIVTELNTENKYTCIFDNTNQIYCKTVEEVK